MTDSSRRSSSSAAPSGTPRTSIPRSAGAGTDRESRAHRPGTPAQLAGVEHEGRPWVEVGAFSWSLRACSRHGIGASRAPGGTGTGYPTVPSGPKTPQSASIGPRSALLGVLAERVALLVRRVRPGRPAGARPLSFSRPRRTAPMRLLEDDLEVGQLGVDVVVDLARAASRPPRRRRVRIRWACRRASLTTSVSEVRRAAPPRPG